MQVTVPLLLSIPLWLSVNDRPIATLVEQLFPGANIPTTQLSSAIYDATFIYVPFSCLVLLKPYREYVTRFFGSDDPHTSSTVAPHSIVSVKPINAVTLM